MKKISIYVLLSLGAQTVVAQNNSLEVSLEAQTTITENGTVPFWMRSNQFGNEPTSGASGALIGRAEKPYSSQEYEYKFDWSAATEFRTNVGEHSNLRLIEGYGKIKYGPLQLKLGRSKDVVGLTGDTILSSGSFAISGNAPGIPKVELSIPEYWTLPIFNGLVAIKGSFAHGWLGRTLLRDGQDKNIFDYTQEAKTFFHQKSFYGRFGADDWRLKVFGGFNHQVFWGSEKQILGDGFDLNSFQTFSYVVFGKAYGGKGKDSPRSKIGNHLGSIDLGITYDFENVQLSIYRQNFYDVGALSKLANIKDGLNGIVIKNIKPRKSSVYLKKILVEFLYTKNQAGEFDSKQTASGDEDYYNNYIYAKGWSYSDKTLGTPFITNKLDARTNLINVPKDFFLNNRVIAYHLGFDASVKAVNIQGKLSLSQNFGTFGTSIEGRSRGPNRNPPAYGIFQRVSQFSSFLKAEKAYQNYTFGLVGAYDNGMLLNNSYGVSLFARVQF